MRVALFIIACAIATPAFAEQSKGVTACHIESVDQDSSVIVASGAENCKGTIVRSYGQTGGITAGSIGTVTMGPARKPAASRIAICRTDPVLDITVRGKALSIKGGRRCSTNEQATVILDASTFAIVGGVNTGTLNMSIVPN